MGEGRSAWPAVECSKSEAAAAGGERERARVDFFAAGTSGWLKFCALRPRVEVEVGVGVAWFGSLEHVTQRLALGTVWFAAKAPGYPQIALAL